MDSFDLSFNASALLEDHHLDTTDLLSDATFGQSPVKKNSRRQPASPKLASVTCPQLPCSFSSGDLFSVTHRRRLEQNEQSLHNDKIHKLLESLQGENSEYDLDDQLRTRVFRARAKPPVLDTLDLQLDSYLRDDTSRADFAPQRRKGARPGHNADKENHSPVPEPSKRKLADSAKRPLKKSRSYTSIPLLQVSRQDNCPGSPRHARASPQRVCVPKPVGSPGRPSLKNCEDVRIFLVDSSTGSVADATQFGTEINAANCKGFPLPDNVNEMTQIPTYDSEASSSAQKMAIIRASMGRSQAGRKAANGERKGFYSKREFDDQGALLSLGSAVGSSLAVFNDQKRVRWADELEW